MTTTLPATHDANSTFGPLYYVTGAAHNDFVFKGAVYNTTSAAPVPISLSFPGVQSGDRAQLTVLTAPSGPYAMNEVGGPNVVDRKVSMLTTEAEGAFVFELPQWSVAVVRTVNVTAGNFIH